jgi:hypothetical protein
MIEKQGLKVVSLSPAAEREFRKEVARIYPQIRGTLVPALIFDMTVDTLKSGGESAK